MYASVDDGEEETHPSSGEVAEEVRCFMEAV
jgi:hypothetical protein